jgi:hypothetical protein
MSKIHLQMIAALLALALVGAERRLLRQAPAAESGKAISPEQFAAVYALIKPQAGESKWASVPWLTNLQEARRRAVAEDKPLLLWRSGGGDVLGRT